MGATGLNIPTAEAQMSSARRFIVFYSPDGTQYDHWRPQQTQEGLTFQPGSILEPLASVKQHLTVLDGIQYTTGREHFRGMTLMLTNSGFVPPGSSHTDGASVDQYIGSHIGRQTRFSSLELGVQCSVLGAIPEARMCFRRSGETVPPNENPADVHRRLFGDVRADAARLLANRQSVLDLVGAETRALASDLPLAEKRKLDIHLQALREVERGLESVGPTCEVAPEASPLAHLANDNFPAVGRAQMDLMVAAMACDLTRVASIQWSLAASPTVFSWLGHARSHHSLSHIEDPDSPGVRQFLAGERWYAEQFKYLVERLDSLPEPGGSGTLLDNTLILWVTEVGNRLTHVCEDMPIVLAGGASGHLQPGRMLNYPGESHGKLMTSICKIMGIDVPSFGNPRHGVGELAGLRT